VTLAAGERVVLVQDQAAFQAAYPGVAIAGVYTGQLSNGGETLTLRDIAENILCSVTYGDSNTAGWPPEPDGEGRSLVLKRPSPTTDENNPTNWRASVSVGGTPGGSDATTFNGGNPNADADGDGFAAIVEYAMGTDDTNAQSVPVITPGNDFGAMTLTVPHRAGADDVLVEALESADLLSWSPISPIADIPAQNGMADRTWRCSSAFVATGRAYLRVRVTPLL
jgi:hypothetical protein